jgi:predicted nucleic acid-binding protein
LTIQTTNGDIALKALYGRDRDSGKRVMPLRERLGLRGKQPMTPVLEDRLCHLAVTARSYEAAAEVAVKWGVATDDSQIHRVARRVGERAEAQAEQRVSAAFDLRESKEIIREAELELRGERFSMVLMLDGMMLRSRGQDWGLKPAFTPGERVAWHELKAGLVIRLPEVAEGKRRELAKYYVADAGGPEAIGRKLYAEALRRGLEKAERVYVVADGAVWIWNVAAEHFPGSVETLDFYHATEHVWALAKALWGDGTEEAKAWATPLVRNLKRCGGEPLLAVLEGLLRQEWDAGQRKELARETAYFNSHASRLDYPRAKREGTPLGSGSMESACSQIQGRFKRTGQFWSRPGERHLLALELAWRNRDWHQLWAQAA